MVELATKYLDKTHSEKLRAALKAFCGAISRDQYFIDRKYWSQKDWEMYDAHFKKILNPVAGDIADWLIATYPEIKSSISKHQIIEILRGGGLAMNGIVYALTFDSIPLLVQTDSKDQGPGFVVTFEPRNMTLKSIITHPEEMNSVIALFDQTIAGHANFYSSHKCIAITEVTNIRISDLFADVGKDFEWNFGGVIFLLREGDLLPQHLKWVRDSAQISDLGMAERFHTFALIRYEGSSSSRAFILAFDYFNFAFGLLRILATLRLPRQSWTSRGDLEIPAKQPGFISSSDPMTWLGISPKLDNDFFSASKENSVCLPIILNKKNVELLEADESFVPMQRLLERVRDDKKLPIDEKIMNALSWFSESQKNFISIHKIVGFITALETLLTGQKLVDGISDKSISEMFSERGAIILHKTYEERLAAKRNLKGIYSLRSKIVHGSGRSWGKSDDEENQKVFEIETITAQIVAKVIGLVESEHIASIPELNTFVEKQLLS